MNDVTDDRWRVRWRPMLWGGAACLLLLPLVAMQFTREVTWDAADFLVFGAMLVVACGAFELAVQATRRAGTRVLAAAGIAGAFLLVWAELAVGIFH